MKYLLKGLLKWLLPKKIYKLLANGAIVVPRYYSHHIEELEEHFNITLQSCDKKDVMLMRKYAHIIDKGLHRRDACSGHSRVYYEDLMGLIERLSDTEYAQDPTLKWAKEKISQYELLQNEGVKFTPLEGSASYNADISFTQLVELIKFRRSNRYFKEELINDEIINNLKELMNWAANSCNKQAVECFVTNDPVHASKCLKCCAGGTGFSKFIPSFWCFTANVRGYVWPSELYLPAIDVSLGAQNLFLGATTLGISGTILSWAQHTKQDDDTLRELLNIPCDHTIVFCAVLGYAEYEYSTPARKLTK